MSRFTVVCSCAAYYAATVTVEAATLEQALEAAIEKADETEAWARSDHAGAPFVVAFAEGEDADPWGEEALPVPGRFTEAGEPPLVVVTGAAPAGGIRVVEGRARIRYVRDAGTFTADLHDRRAPHHGQPLVSVVRRADGTPHVTVVGGNVRVLFYEEEAVEPVHIAPTPRCASSSTSSRSS